MDSKIINRDPFQDIATTTEPQHLKKYSSHSLPRNFSARQKVSEQPWQPRPFIEEGSANTLQAGIVPPVAPIEAASAERRESIYIIKTVLFDASLWS